jgi:hypothetical protein
MASETPSSPPPSTDATPAAAAARAQASPAPKLDIEYDDFGLPIRQRRPRTPVAQDDSDDDAAAFRNTVVSQPGALEAASLPDKTADDAETVKESTADEVQEKGKGKEKEHETPEELPHLNGDVAERKSESSKSVDNEPADVKSADVEAAHGTSADDKLVNEKAIDDKLVDDKLADDKHETLPPLKSLSPAPAQHHQQSAVSEYSHQAAALQPVQKVEENEDDDGGWQTMPAYARYDMYDDDNRLIAKENTDELEDMHGYANVGGAAKGYTRVIMDDDADSQTSMDDNTAYLFKEKSTALYDEEEGVRDPLTQMEATKNLLTEGQRIAYVGLVRLAMIEMERKFSKIERKSKPAKKALDMQVESTKMWAQKTMVRLYKHMDVTASEQVMIEQLSEHGVIPADLTPALMKNARVKNPVAKETEETDKKSAEDSARPSVSSPRPDKETEKSESSLSLDLGTPSASPPPPPYEEHPDDDEYPEPKTPSQLPDTKNLDIDLRWTVLCDIFLVLIADSIYDARSRELFQVVGGYLSVDWLEICRFEKRVTDALEMQEEADKENWNEEEHMEARRKRALRKRIAFMGLATVGGGLVIGLSAGLLAPMIGAGLAAGLTTVVGASTATTGTFLAGAGGAAIITTTAAISGSTIGVRAANRRTGAVKTFEYRPLHNNKRTNLIITLAGWMSGKADDVRLPYSTVDPIMGDLYSVLWEPEMLKSMGATINILATEVSILSHVIHICCTDTPLGSYAGSPASPRQYYSHCSYVRHAAAHGLD